MFATYLYPILRLISQTLKKWLQTPWLQPYLPKSVSCFQEGYSTSLFLQDAKAGITVGIIALPLAMAFAIGSGVAPEQGLYTAIIAGFIISLFGGSRVQIGGPTGAFVVLVYATLQKHGIEGLALATFLAGLILICFGVMRLGYFMRFIPFPVITGFTTGIATVIFLAQIKDFCGMEVSLPADVLGKITQYAEHVTSSNPFSITLSLCSLLVIFFFRYRHPKIPGAIIAVVVATAASVYFQLPVTTIESMFGAIPQSLPAINFGFFSFSAIQNVLPDAFAIAILGGLESLLSCVIADTITGFKHRSSSELIAQGLANIGSSIFGGIPATGAIARTTANIQMGAKTPVSGMIHALTLFGLMMFLAPFASKIPLCTLAAVLMIVAYNMSELHHFFSCLKGPIHDRVVLLTTYFLTVFVDLTFAVQIGVALAALLFLKQMAEHGCQFLESKAENEEDDTVILEVEGPFFFAVSNQLHEILRNRKTPPKIFVIKMPKVPFIDASGLHALSRLQHFCKRSNIELRVTEINCNIAPLLKKAALLT